MAKNTTDAKNPGYSKAELAELKAWFDEHKAQIPEQLQLNSFTFYSQLPNTVQWLIEVAEEHIEHKFFRGYYARLVEIKAKMISEGLV